MKPDEPGAGSEPPAATPAPAGESPPPQPPAAPEAPDGVDGTGATCAFHGISLPLAGGKVTNCSDRAASVHHTSTDGAAMLEGYRVHAEAGGFSSAYDRGDVILTKGSVVLEMSAFADTDNGEVDVIVQRRASGP